MKKKIELANYFFTFKTLERKSIVINDGKYMEM